jgi:hypothetical protein
VAQKLRTRSITAENLFTDPAEIVGHFNISISGTWVGIVTVQRAYDGGSTWFDVATWTTNAQEYGFEPERQVQYRIGIKTGEYGSGQADLRLSQ